MDLGCKSALRHDNSHYRHPERSRFGSTHLKAPLPTPPGSTSQLNPKTSAPVFRQRSVKTQDREVLHKDPCNSHLYATQPTPLEADLIPALPHRILCLCSDAKMSRTSFVSIFAINEIPSIVASLPEVTNCFLRHIHVRLLQDFAELGKATAFLTAIRTNGFNKYLKAASKFSLTDCVIAEHITTVLLLQFTLLRKCCIAAAMSLLGTNKTLELHGGDAAYPDLSYSRNSMAGVPVRRDRYLA